MDVLYCAVYYTGLFIAPIVAYFVFFKKQNENSSYSDGGWFYLIKLYAAKKQVQKYQEKYRVNEKKLGQQIESEIHIPTSTEKTISQSFTGQDQLGNSLALKLVIGIDKIAEARLHLRLSDGNTYVFPGEEGTCLTNLAKGQWKIGGVNVEVLEKFRRLRITFNGLLRNISSRSSGIEHVQFNFLFTACESPNYVPQDIDKAILADGLARETWRDSSWVENLVDQSGFEQFGVMKGFVRGDSYPEEHVLNLPALRTNYTGLDDSFVNDRAVRIFLVDTYGNLLNVVLKSMQNGCSQLSYGFAFLSSNRRSPITNIDIQMTKNMGQNKIIPSILTAHVGTEKKNFQVVLHLNVDAVWQSERNTPYGYENFVVPTECNLNLNRGKGVVEFWYNKNGNGIFIPERKLCEKEVDTLPNVLVTNINDEDSQILELTGGKGNSLALMTNMNSDDFIIPEGFIVTVKAHQLQLKSNPVLVKSIEILNDICCGKIEGKLEEACKETISYFKETQICPQIVEAITKELSRYAHDDNIGWAVRSSAVGEDSEELSAAGQNETFLGCRTNEQILESVIACWASLYTCQSVLYRWQHGLPVKADMAVVIQKMVAAECAGVLFTCHPSTSNPREMVITSNFGLGESVVSGSSEPDTFILHRTWNNEICLSHKKIGSKSLVLTMTSKGVEESSSNSDNNKWSLTEEQVIQLGNVGIQLEQAFGNHRDVEWAFCKGKLYLLQSRPITTLNAWTEFELTHELDSPILTDKSIVTLGNIGEVVHNAVTALSYSSTVRVMDECMQKYSQLNFDPCSRKGLITFKHNAMIDLVTSIHRNVSVKPMVTSLILDLAIFGHPVLNDQINEILVNRLGITPRVAKIKETWNIWTSARSLKQIVNQAKSLVKELDYASGNAALSHVLKRISSSFDTLVEIAISHAKTSSVSACYQVILMSVMLEGQQELSNDHISDFALILSSCEDVVSAEVPRNLEEIAKEIKSGGASDEFCSIKKEAGISWIEKNCPSANNLLKEFFRNHGHRSLEEFELIAESWNENPSAIITMIQSNIKHGRNIEKKKTSLEEVLAKLVSPSKGSTRFIIKFLMKRLRVAVGCREQTKSELVRAFDKLRLAYRHLSLRMVQEGLLPSKELIYHLTHEEIQQIVEKRNPILINKAVRRQKLYTKWNSLKFPEMMFGIPAPEPETEIQINPLLQKCKGTPVCTGVVQARACVINSIDEINQLQTGDILITHSTDIGWSPYFPMLSGIVTELGGLISHGAVVAREYGLPCIVGVQNATKYFTTGDTLILNGKTGEIGKL